MVYMVSVTVSVKVRKELMELADNMVKYGLAKSRSHAFNIMIEKGLSKVVEEVEFWDSAHEKAEELKKTNFKIRHGRLKELLEEDRAR
jgi:mRNA-degrading endonuclease RelE of RelBE toxin-antitoxin system